MVCHDRTNLSGPIQNESAAGAWVDLGSASAATNLLLNASDTIGTNRQRFYRIIASP
jgi:hypothetical protein